MNPEETKQNSGPNPPKKPAGNKSSNVLIAAVAALIVVMLAVFALGVSGQLPFQTASAPASSAGSAASETESQGTGSGLVQAPAKTGGGVSADSVQNGTSDGASSDGTDALTALESTDPAFAAASSGSASSVAGSVSSAAGTSSGAAASSTSSVDLSGILGNVLPSTDSTQTQTVTGDGSAYDNSGDGTASSQSFAGPDDYSGATVSMQEYNALTAGMTYKQVVAAVGGPGKLSDQTGNTQTYDFPGYGSSDALVRLTFKSGLLYKKYQFGL